MSNLGKNHFNNIYSIFFFDVFAFDKYLIL